MTKIINPLTARAISPNSNIYKLLTNDTIFKNENNILIPLNKKLYFFDEKRNIWLHNKFKKESKTKKSKPFKQKTESKQKTKSKQEIFLLEDKIPETKQEKTKPLLLTDREKKRRGSFKMTRDDYARANNFADDTELRKFKDRLKIINRRKEELYNNPKLLEKLKKFFQKRYRLKLDFDNYYNRDSKKFTEEELEKRNQDLWDELKNEWLQYDDKLIKDKFNEHLLYYKNKMYSYSDVFNKFWNNYIEQNGITWLKANVLNRVWSVSKEDKKEATKLKMLPQDMAMYNRILRKSDSWGGEI